MGSSLKYRFKKNSSAYAQRELPCIMQFKSNCTIMKTVLNITMLIFKSYFTIHLVMDVTF